MQFIFLYAIKRHSVSVCFLEIAELSNMKLGAIDSCSGVNVIRGLMT